MPAVIFVPDKCREWWQHNQLHRDGDLPAVVWRNGIWLWYKHGKLHRDGDLPAVVRANGHQEWWVDGRFQSDLDREQTQKAMAEARRWSPLRAAFVGAAACALPLMS
jgi:hypothetical protein